MSLGPFDTTPPRLVVEVEWDLDLGDYRPVIAEHARADMVRAAMAHGFDRVYGEDAPEVTRQRAAAELSVLLWLGRQAAPVPRLDARTLRTLAFEIRTYSGPLGRAQAFDDWRDREEVVALLLDRAGTPADDEDDEDELVRKAMERGAQLRAAVYGLSVWLGHTRSVVITGGRGEDPGPGHRVRITDAPARGGASTDRSRPRQGRHRRGPCSRRTRSARSSSR